MKLYTENNANAFIAKQIVEHKMPKITTAKWETKTVRIDGRFAKVYSRNNGSYFIKKGVNYYVASADFKNHEKFATELKIDKAAAAAA
jgi:hypothetical protein